MMRLLPLAADDAQVIAASLAEPGRFAALFDRHAPHIHRYLARRVGPQVAEDLLAETFLVAFGKRAAYDLAFRDARGWLYGIATHLVGQHRREEIRQFRLSQATGPDVDQIDYSERSVVRLTAQSVRSVLVAALAELAEPDRDVLLLFAWEQLSYEEVARALGIPVGTVRSRLHRARAKTVGSMLQSDYFLPAQRAALYEFLATTPGLVVEHNVRDIAGRPGVGVGWSFEGSRAMNIFDPASYAYLGMTTWGQQDQQGGDALLQTAVVSYPGQVP